MERIFAIACYCSECENKSYALRVTDDGTYNLLVQSPDESYTVEFDFDNEQKIIQAELFHSVFKMVEMLVVQCGQEVEEPMVVS